MTKTREKQLKVFWDKVFPHRKVLINFALSRKVADAEDFVDDMLVSLALTFPRKERIDNLGGFLIKVLKDRLKDYYKREEKNRARYGKMPNGAAYTIEDGLNQRVLFRQMKESLSAEEYAFLSAYYVEGFSVEELATCYDLSPVAAKVKLHRIRERLRKTLEV